MTIDFWGLGLQAVNVLILVWLLSHVFWRPVAAAIAKRQDTATSLIEAVKTTQAEADEALEEAAKARAGIEAERIAMLDAARKDAATATKATLAEARTKADAMITAARTTAKQDRETAHKENESQAADLAMKITARLLERLNNTATQSAFLAQLVKAIAKMPSADLTALLDAPEGIEVVTASATGIQNEHIKKAVTKALGGKPNLKFVTDPNLIGGLELRSPHFTLRNSWQADLRQVQREVRDAT